MRPNKTLLIAVSSLVASILHADVVDPVAALQSSAHLPSGTIVYLWEANVEGNGRNVIFIDLDEDFHRKIKHYENMPSWYVYLQNATKTGYIRSRGVEVTDLGPGVAPTAPQINIDNMYIGPVSELGKAGIVTIQIDYSKVSTAYIRAYTVEGDHLKETLLAQYDPTKASNAIYDQYLSKEHRTTVKLEKIILK